MTSSTELVSIPYLHHLQISLDRGGKQILVDAGLANLLEELWAQGFITHASCQGYEQGSYMQSLPYIMFEDVEQARVFVSEYGGTVEFGMYTKGHAVVRGFLIEV